MPSLSSKGLFNTGLFKPALFATGVIRGTGAVVIPRAPGFPGLGGGISPGIDYESFFTPAGPPPAIWAAPPAIPVVNPMVTDYIGGSAGNIVYIDGAVDLQPLDFNALGNKPSAGAGVGGAFGLTGTFP